MTAVRLASVSVDLLDARVLTQVDLAVADGSWLTLVGPNGAGKTTLLRAITAAIEHTGRIELGQTPVNSMRHHERARVVAVMPQRPILPDGMSVWEYVLLGRTPHVPYFGVESATDKAVVDDLLEVLELEPMAARPITTLSGGETQRAVLARALAQQAPVLLLDEPTGPLDLGHAQQVLELVDRMRRERGLTVVAALHDLTTAGQFSDRLVLLVGGEVVAAGTPEKVLTEELISTHYQARVRVVRDPAGGVTVIPVRDR